MWLENQDGKSDIMPKKSYKKRVRAVKKRQRRRDKTNRKNMLNWASQGKIEGSILSPFNIKDIRTRARNYRKRGGK